MLGFGQLLSQQTHQLCRRGILSLRSRIDVPVAVVGSHHQAHG